MNKKLDITAIILTKNEEENIENCILSIIEHVKRIVVVDSGSQDNTISLAKKYNANIFENVFYYYSQQFNWALDNTKIMTKWVLRIDADEVFSEKLWLEIRNTLEDNNKENVSALAIEADLFFLGKKIRYGSAKKRKVMIFKKQFGRIENIKRDAHAIISEGKVLSLKNRFIHRDYKSINEYIERYNKYSSFEADDFLKKSNLTKTNLSDSSIKRKRKLKHNVYYKFPMFLRAKLWYIYNYYFKLGFLDGKEGKIYNFLECYWYRFLVDSKIYEIKIMNSNDNIEEASKSG